MDTISTSASVRRYERDFLLQLRLHPYSLQKPKNLEDIDIVKDKLYLHQMDNFLSSNSNISHARTQRTMKPDSELMFRSRGILSNYYPRSPLYATSYKSNYGYHGMYSKSRPLYSPDSIHPARKCFMSPSPDSKFELLDDIFSPNWSAAQTSTPWSKQSYYDGLWNSYSRPLPNNTSKDQYEVPVKSKKTLQIIDPSNGKNILDGILKSPTPSQESIEDIELENKGDGLLSATDELAAENTNERDALGTLSNGNEGEIVDSAQEVLNSISENMNKSPGENGLKISTPLKENQNEGINAQRNQENIEKPFKDVPCEEKMCGFKEKSSFNHSENAFTKSTDKENCNDYSLSYHARRNDVFTPRNGTIGDEEKLRSNIALLKEKFYSLRQEQQKMGIYQSFLLYKKHQLDEIVRSLDEEKVEIANWKCNLVGKEKRLKEREDWLEVKKNILKNKEEELCEKERKLVQSSDKFVNGSLVGNDEITKGETSNAIEVWEMDKYVNGIVDEKLSIDLEKLKICDSANILDQTGKIVEEPNEDKGASYSKGIKNCNGVEISLQNGIDLKGMNGEYLVGKKRKLDFSKSAMEWNEVQ